MTQQLTDLKAAAAARRDAGNHDAAEYTALGFVRRRQAVGGQTVASVITVLAAVAHHDAPAGRIVWRGLQEHDVTARATLLDEIEQRTTALLAELGIPAPAATFDEFGAIAPELEAWIAQHARRLRTLAEA